VCFRANSCSTQLSTCIAIDLQASLRTSIQQYPNRLLLTPSDQVLYSTQAGELANARRMGDARIYDFFQGARDAPARKPT
jgi:hypothetical protein